MHLGNSDRRAEIGWLHEDGILQLGLDLFPGFLRFLLPLPTYHSAVLHNGQAGSGKQTLHDILVHPRSRAEHSRANVRNSGELEKALDGAILSEGSVKHGEDHVNIDGLVRRTMFRRGTALEWNQRMM